MGKHQVSSELERKAMVLYAPAARAFWTGKRTAPDRLRNAKVFYHQFPLPPAGTVYMRVGRARKMVNCNQHERFLSYLQLEDREFFEQFAE